MIAEIPLRLRQYKSWLRFRDNVSVLKSARQAATVQRGTGLLTSGNRVGLRLRVEIVNLLAIAVFDDSAAQLQGGGEGSVVG